MESRGLKEEIFNIPIFRAKMHVIEYKCLNRMRERLTSVMSIDYIESALLHEGFFFDRDNVFYVCINTDDGINHGTIAHECNHAANEILSTIGHKAELSNDEVQSYLLGYIVDLVYSVIDTVN